MLSGVRLRTYDSWAIRELRKLFQSIDLPQDRCPAFRLHLVREPRGPLASRKMVLKAEWQEGPVTLWLRGFPQPIVAASITYSEADLAAKFETTFQSWDTANKPTELADYSVCTTWGVKDKHAYLLHVVRKRLGYPELKRAVREQAEAFCPQTILIEDKASGIQLIQELVNEGIRAIRKFEPTMDKIMRMHSVTSTIENGFVQLPDKAAWLP